MVSPDDVPRLLTMRDQAKERNDWSMVLEINSALGRLGYREIVPAPPVVEKRKPGRPRKAAV